MVNNKTYGLVVPIFNRPQYVKRCFESLRKLTGKPNFIVLVDDCSTDVTTKDLVASFTLDGVQVQKIRHAKNTGIKGALISGCAWLWEQGCFAVVNLDSDGVIKPDGLAKIAHVFEGVDNCIVSGFNCVTERNPTREIYKGLWIAKDCLNGINMCFNKQQYDSWILPALSKPVGNWDYDTSVNFQTAGRRGVVLTPSVVQHIGMVSSMGHDTNPDIAQDFKFLTLPDVTLFGIDSHNKAGIILAADLSQRDIDFGAVKIITDDLFTKGGSSAKRREDYSRFMMKELDRHFTTSHVLTIHADGYVLNWDAWQDEWLQYDYIGATWGYKDNMNVGNGGFSLRSKKLCNILATHKLTHLHPEDMHICRTYRGDLEKTFGIRFAPEEVANRFSIEAYGANAFPGANKYAGQFGFHSPHVDLSALPKHLQLK